MTARRGTQHLGRGLMVATIPGILIGAYVLGGMAVGYPGM